MKLHDYQEVARDFLRGRGRAGLFLDMGVSFTPMSTCAGCGDEFEPNYPEQKYHSHPCFVQSLNKNREVQSKKGRLGGEVRGQQMKADSSGKSYLKVPRTDTHEHRAVAERVLQRKLHPREVVHHDDLNKQNNDPSNLIVFVSQAQHARHHGLGHCGLPKCDCYGIRLGEVTPNAAP